MDHRRSLRLRDTETALLEGTRRSRVHQDLGERRGLMAGTDTGGRALDSTPCSEPSCRQAFLTRTRPNPVAGRHLRPNNQQTGTQPCPLGDVLLTICPVPLVPTPHNLLTQPCPPEAQDQLQPSAGRNQAPSPGGLTCLRPAACRTEATLTESQTRWGGEDYVPEEGARQSPGRATESEKGSIPER